MRLGKRQKKVLESLIASDCSVAEISIQTGIDRDIISNILREFYDAEMITKTEEGLFSVHNVKPAREQKTAGEPTDSKDEWAEYKPVLKNLSRIL